MHKQQSLLVLGVWLVIIPFLGIRSDWKTVLTIATGLGLIATYLYRKAYVKEGNSSASAYHGSTFVENRNSVGAH